MPGRGYNVGTYRFSFNGIEQDSEVKGIGNHIDFGARGYDPLPRAKIKAEPINLPRM